MFVDMKKTCSDR